MILKTLGARAVVAALLLLAGLWLASAPAQAQQNSPQAAEAARKYRAEKAGGTAPPAQRATAAGATGAPVDTTRPFRSGANPNADPNASLKSCLDHVGINPVARDRCMRQHCEGRWGQGQCPTQGGDLFHTKANANTPLGRCLTEAGNNPFKRDGCGWRHCRPRWESAECQALQPNKTPSAY